MSKLPVKFRIVQLISQKENISNEEILAILKDEYPLDKQVTEKGIENQLLSIKAVGIIEGTSASFNNAGKLIQNFKITSYGTSKLKYLN